MLLLKHLLKLMADMHTNSQHINLQLLGLHYFRLGGCFYGCAGVDVQDIRKSRLA